MDHESINQPNFNYLVLSGFVMSHNPTLFSRDLGFLISFGALFNFYFFHVSGGVALAAYTCLEFSFVPNFFEKDK